MGEPSIMQESEGVLLWRIPEEYLTYLKGVLENKQDLTAQDICEDISNYFVGKEET